MLVPRPALAAAFALPIGVATLMVVDLASLGHLLTVNGALVLLAAFDALLLGKVRVEVQREVPRVFSLGRNNIVKLFISAPGRRSLDLTIEQELFDHQTTTGLPARIRVTPGPRAEVSYVVIPQRRGAYAIGDHVVRVRSPMSLWWRQLRREASDSVRVYPDLQSLRVFDLMARQDREHAFLRAQRLRGGESEFARLRDYSKDDEYRAIDWRATARRQRLTAREYQLESNQNLFFLLEAGRSMTAMSGATSLFDHALNALLLLGQVATRNGDRVGLMSFEQTVLRYVAPSGGSQATKRLIHATYDLHPRVVEPDYDSAFNTLAQRLRRRSLVIIFAQVLDDAVAETLSRRIRALMPRHLPVLALFRDESVDRLMNRPSKTAGDLYTRAAAAEILHWRRGLMQQLRAHGALVMDVRAGELTPQLVNNYLEIKARHLL